MPVAISWVVWRGVLRKKRVLVDKLKKEVSITKSLLQDAYTIQTCNWLLGSDSVKNIRLVNHINAKGAIFAAHHATKSNNQHFELFSDFLKNRQAQVTPK